MQEELLIKKLFKLLIKANKISNCNNGIIRLVRDRISFIVLDNFDDTLYNYLDRIKPNGLSPNLIKKIISQLRYILEGLEGEIGQRFINPMNIYIKYINSNKNNFDVFGIYKLDDYDFYSFYFYHPNILESLSFEKNHSWFYDKNKKI